VAKRIEAVTVDTGLILFQAEETGLRVSGLNVSWPLKYIKGIQLTCGSGVTLPIST